MYLYLYKAIFKNVFNEIQTFIHQIARSNLV